MNEPDFTYIGAEGSRRRYREVDGAAQVHFECWACKMWFDDHVRPKAIMLSQKVLCDGPGSCAEKARTGPDGVRKVDSGAPLKFLGASLDDISKARQPALRAWPDKLKFLFIVGESGAGKTHACWAVIQNLAATGRGTVYWDDSDLRTHWHGIFPKQREELVRRLQECDRLVLDDITRTTPTDSWTSVLTDILKHRLDGNRPTILTSMATLTATIELLCGEEGKKNPALTRRLKEFSVGSGRVCTLEKRAVKEKS